MDEFICEAFADQHRFSAFACGEKALDDWLRRSARDSDGRGITRTYVWHRGDGVVVGYYALEPYLIQREILTTSQSRGLPDAIPCYLLAKLALDRTLRGQGLGTHLLASALANAATAAASVGGRFVVVDALTPPALAFYLHHGFVPVPGLEHRLVLRIREIDGLLGRAE